MDEQTKQPWDYWPDIQPGGKISFQRGDQIYTDTIRSVSYSTQPYVAAPELPRWQRIVRRFTPRRWRKPLPQPSGGMAVMTIKTDPFWAVGTPTEKP